MSLKPIDKKWIVGSILLILFFRLIVQIAVYRAGFISLTADEFGRTIVAARWSEHPTWIWSGAWLPLHTYLIGTALHFLWELLWVPRSLSLICGAVSLVITYALAANLFQSRLVGVISAFLLSINPAHIWLTATPLTEMPNAMLVLAAVWGFVVYLKKGKLRYLWIAAGSLALANGFRFEPWIISALFSLVLLTQGLAHIIQRKARLRELANPALAMALPWLIPIAWMIGNYQETGNPLNFLQAIRAYKAHWYASSISYLKYFETFRKIDPYLTFLALFAIAACLFLNKRSWPVRWYIAVATLPLVADILMQGGQSEPPGNYIRYFALFSFLLYPALGYLLVTLTKVIPLEKLRFGIIPVLAIMAFTQVRAAFRFTNDPSAAGLAVGIAIRDLRAQNPVIADRPVIIELSYWQYLAIKVGANDLDGVVYDRDLDTANRQTQSLLLTNEPAFSHCLQAYNVSYVIVKDAALRQALERDLGLSADRVVNEYAFYPVGPLASAPGGEVAQACPLVYTPAQ